jgi:anti-sigma B factor antagonist
MISKVIEHGDVRVVRISGRLDASSAAETKEALLQMVQDGATRLVLSLGELTFIDSSGLGVLVSCLRRVSAAGGDLRLACVPPLARSIFELTRLSRVFDLDDDETAALERLGESP